MAEGGQKKYKRADSLKGSMKMFESLNKANKKPIERIDIILNRVGETWRKNPDWGFGQVLYTLNCFGPAAGGQFDTFQYSDDLVIENMKIPLRDRMFLDVGSSKMLLKNIPTEDLRDILLEADEEEDIKTIKMIKEEIKLRKIMEQESVK